VAAGPEEAFGQVLFELRREGGLSQEDLGFAAGYHPTYISQLERGVKSPTLRAVYRLGAALHVSAASIVQRTEEQYRRQADA